MIEFSEFKIFLLTVSYVSIMILIHFVTRQFLERLISYSTITGFLLYSGIATTDVNVPYFLLFAYFAFSISLVVGFSFGLHAFKPLGRTIWRSAGPVIDKLTRTNVANWIIVIFLFTNITNLIFPDFKLHLLFSPPSPSISGWFESRFEHNQVHFLSSLFRYIEILLTPFFYIALYGIRRHLFVLAGLLSFLLYIQYIADAYIGRYHILLMLLFIGIVVWVERPKLRLITLGVGAASVPLLLSAFAAYRQLRLGVDVELLGEAALAIDLLNYEFSFLKRYGLYIFFSEKHANLGEYFYWMLTLPVPSFLKGDIEEGQIGYELSEIFLGVPRGSSNFNVILVTPLIESIYLYGKNFFWFHGIFVGLLMAFFVRILDSTRSLSFLFYSVALTFAFNFNRAGIGSLLSAVVNEFLFFYLFLAVAVFRRRPGHFQRATLPPIITDGGAHERKGLRG